MHPDLKNRITQNITMMFINPNFLTEIYYPSFQLKFGLLNKQNKPFKQIHKIIC